MKRVLKKWLLGISVPQEYVCLGQNGYNQPLQVSAKPDLGAGKIDVTSRHLFLGYKPLLIAIPWQGAKEDGHSGKLHLDFLFHTGETVARLELKEVNRQTVDGTSLVCYEGVAGKHLFITTLHQTLNAIYDKFRTRRPGNIELNGNLYEQVRIAYSVPRTISLITVFDGERMNLFPTDLHGIISDEFYCGSLRKGGRACQQVERQGRIVVSEVDAGQYREAYQLGKRHMMEMVAPAQFNLDETISSTFKFPLPVGVGCYRELEVVGHFDCGIHRVFTYRIVNAVKVRDFDPLGHIHRYFAQWRENRGLKTSYLLR